jgi:hypothetical protein
MPLVPPVEVLLPLVALPAPAVPVPPVELV